MTFGKISAFVFCLAFSASMFAAQVTGTVTNATTNKPAAGSEVVLLSLAGGMDEVAKGTCDAQGRFAVDVPDPGVPHLLRVNHQGVNYFQNVPPGTASADITIYDAAKKVDGIFEDARVYRLQTERAQLEVSATYTLRNASQPPRTRMDNETFEVELPKDAQLVNASAMGPSGLPVSTSPVPTGKNNRYALVFPIRPGKAQFHVDYTLPYSGAYEFAITTDSSLSEFGVLLPKTMHFNGLSRNFSQDSDEAGLAVFFTKDVPAHALLKFSVSGEGIAPREAQAGDASPDAPAGAVPAGASDSKSNTLWYVLAAMIIVVAGGAFWLWKKSPGAARDKGKAASAGKAQANKARRAGAAPAQEMSSQDSMLETLKDELFQLETDRLNGRVSNEEYEKSKAGLDALLRRQLKKSGQRT